ncbi:MAG: sulfurtransferase [Geminicoccaceae bacterium]|jgi:thiosulfate/3-mercaptopyruvate sulfurtransferase|nr:MAG: sulfurtransferase [Geminicoccaceae bacterium]
MSALVSTDWLAARLSAPDIRVVDATWVMPDSGRDPRAEFEAGHIPGAVFFDIDEICDETSPYPHMVPSAAAFSAKVRKLGLGDGVTVVVYDSNRFCASARVWWMFRLFGHEAVVVLDGGMERWRAEGRPLEEGSARPRERHLTARQNHTLLRELDQMRANVTSRREQVVDTRSPGRFKGELPEPRPGLRSGHIPGSVNVPYSELLAPDGRLKRPSELRPLFVRAGVDLGKPIVCSCGSGVSAAVAALALFELGRPDVAVYDGSWSEWGAQPDTPIER